MGGRDVVIRHDGEELKSILAEFPWQARQLGTQQPLEICWVLDLPVSRVEIWPFLADTSRFNRELGLSPREEREKSGELEITDFIGPFEQRWIEEPWEWVHGHSMQLVRRYEKGAAKWVRSRFVIKDRDGETGCRVVMYFGVIAKNLVWKAIYQIAFSRLATGFERVLNKAVSTILTGRNLRAFQPVLARRPHELSAQSIDRLDQALDAMTSAGRASRDLCQKIRDLILTGDDLDLARLEVLVLAQKWELDYRQVLDTFLYGTKLGLFELSWDIICPHCRGPRNSFDSLKKVVADARCDVCDISFSTAAPDSIEVIFHIHPSVRTVSSRQYCAAEPARKQHVKMQRHLAPDEAFQWRANLPLGRYRIRAKGQDLVSTMEVTSTHGRKDDQLTWSVGKTPPQHLTVSGSTMLVLQNLGSAPTTVAVEELSVRPALTPAMVFQHPDFREWFSEEVLATDVKLQLGHQVIMFTDIVGSTHLYNSIGDSKAFVVVREHFRTIFAEIRRFDGVVVKTIGDAVMASFVEPWQGLQAALAIQKTLTDLRSKDPSVVHIRMALHVGKVLAVHLDTGLDYFGSTVNYAAKIQHVAGAGEIAVSEDLFRSLSNPTRQTSSRPSRLETLSMPGLRDTQKVWIFDPVNAQSEAPELQLVR